MIQHTSSGESCNEGSKLLVGIAAMVVSICRLPIFCSAIEILGVEARITSKAFMTSSRVTSLCRTSLPGGSSTVSDAFLVYLTTTLVFEPLRHICDLGNALLRQSLRHNELRLYLNIVERISPLAVVAAKGMRDSTRFNRWIGCHVSIRRA